MRSAEFEERVRKSGYEPLGMYTNDSLDGQAYLAQKKVIDEDDGPQWQMLWAAGKDGDNLEVGQWLNMSMSLSPHERHELCLAQAEEYLEMRDYSGDSRRK